MIWKKLLHDMMRLGERLSFIRGWNRWNLTTNLTDETLAGKYFNVDKNLARIFHSWHNHRAHQNWWSVGAWGIGWRVENDEESKFSFCLTRLGPGPGDLEPLGPEQQRWQRNFAVCFSKWKSWPRISLIHLITIRPSLIILSILFNSIVIS